MTITAFSLYAEHKGLYLASVIRIRNMLCLNLLTKRIYCNILLSRWQNYRNSLHSFPLAYKSHVIRSTSWQKTSFHLYENSLQGLNQYLGVEVDLLWKVTSSCVSQFLFFVLPPQKGLKRGSPFLRCLASGIAHPAGVRGEGTVTFKCISAMCMCLLIFMSETCPGNADFWVVPYIPRACLRFAGMTCCSNDWSMPVWFQW